MTNTTTKTLYYYRIETINGSTCADCPIGFSSAKRAHKAGTDEMASDGMVGCVVKVSSVTTTTSTSYDVVVE